MRLPSRFLALVLTAVCATTAHADIIFGNLAGYTDDGGQSGTGSSILGQQGSITGNYSGKAIGFTMASVAYNVSSLTLRLSNVTGTTDAPSISIWTSSGGNPGTQVATFTNPVTFNGATATNYVFTPAASITLNSSTTYFIVVQQLSTYVSGATDNSFNWLNGNPTVNPTSIAGIATTPVGRFGNTTSNPTTFNQNSTQYNWFQIEGTISAVPEPSTYAALAGLSVLGLAATRRRRR